MRSATAHLFNARNADGYTAQVLKGVAAVAAKVSQCTRPFIGATPGEMKFRVDSVDLGTPLADTAAALEELEGVYLRDAVYFHDARYAAHLNCPVVIPAR